MSDLVITKPQAALELALLQAEADSVNSSDLYVWLRERGLPDEVAIRIRELVGVTRKIGDKMVSLGKILVIKLIEFARAHPNMLIGIALGAALTALTGAIPGVGPFLAPVAATLGITLGAIAGHRMDKGVQGKDASPQGVFELTQEVIEIARSSFEMLIAVLTAFADEIQYGGAKA